MTCATCRLLRPQSQQTELEPVMRRFLVATEICAEAGQAAIRGCLRVDGGESESLEGTLDSLSEGMSLSNDILVLSLLIMMVRMMIS